MSTPEFGARPQLGCKWSRQWSEVVRVALRPVDIEPADPRLITDVLPVLRELRTHLTPEGLRNVYEKGHTQGLRFLAVYDGEDCVGVAGWRLVVNTSKGLKLYVDDLVTASVRRSAGVGRALLAELEQRAAAAGCAVLDLDSGTQREDAHRFYRREGMDVSSLHFVKPVRHTFDGDRTHLGTVNAGS